MIKGNGKEREMNLTQIEYFLEVAKSLNFTKAAKSLHVSQPALSKQIANLERDLEVLLFFRTNKAVSLTPAGAQLEKDLQVVLI